ncbi:OsmC family protein [Flavobacterium caeni]|uniref:Organic hydroperoxide reductase OsmC/OhrA n=1 Tax=Flavobacterium caeni TaxID=490189 RepID=A0A1G5KAI0_9FLAO|nr:OsmC family protein [Flavobacterium caeni]SCY96959.1 Organic hydroperoxide reductase OsmC/OhrA [Flavobacterium caeni]
MHHYKLHMQWTGNLGTGTSAYRAYSRNHTITFADKPEMMVSADPTFRGDPTRYNPEELLLAALSGCHMMSFLHVCVNAGIVVTAYEDHADGTMVLNSDGSGHFTEVTLRPIVTVAERSMLEKLNDCHHRANQLCFIANSVNFPVKHAATGKVTP